MRILLYSDTHHDAWKSTNWPQPLPAHDLLVLAGDIAEYRDTPGNLPAVLAAIRAQTTAPIVFVPGNHEFHHLDYFQGLERIAADTAKLEITLLHRKRVVFGDVAIHGCTLWSDFRLDGPSGYQAVEDLAATRLIDFKRIRYADGPFSPERCAEIHREERSWLDDSLSQCTAAHQVVVTHFAPIRRCICPRHVGDAANPYFIASCEDVAARHAPALWLYGHTHAPADFIDGQTRFVNRARGYPREPVPADSFSTAAVIEID